MAAPPPRSSIQRPHIPSDAPSFILNLPTAYGLSFMRPGNVASIPGPMAVGTFHHSTPMAAFLSPPPLPPPPPLPLPPPPPSSSADASAQPRALVLAPPSSPSSPRSPSFHPVPLGRGFQSRFHFNISTIRHFNIFSFLYLKISVLFSAASFTTLFADQRNPPILTAIDSGGDQFIPARINQAQSNWFQPSAVKFNLMNIHRCGSFGPWLPAPESGFRFRQSDSAEREGGGGGGGGSGGATVDPWMTGEADAVKWFHI